jgi:hypothetical protein
MSRTARRCSPVRHGHAVKTSFNCASTVPESVPRSPPTCGFSPEFEDSSVTGAPIVQALSSTGFCFLQTRPGAGRQPSLTSPSGLIRRGLRVGKSFEFCDNFRCRGVVVKMLPWCSPPGTQDSSTSQWRTPPSCIERFACPAIRRSPTQSFMGCVAEIEVLDFVPAKGNQLERRWRRYHACDSVRKGAFVTPSR